MPLIYGKDKKGKYVKWGKSGKKYHYKTEAGKSGAINKAKKQAKAIFSGGWREKK